MSKAKEIKGFRPETIQKIVNSLVILINYFLGLLKAGKQVNISISDGNNKIGRCMNVSLAPIVTCANCKECKHYCYDVKACCQYENVRIARAKIQPYSVMIANCSFLNYGKK